MACLANLKQDIKLLESTFTKDHDRFQICSASLDELTCRFIGKNGEKFDIQANIMVRFYGTDLVFRIMCVLDNDCFRFVSYDV